MKSYLNRILAFILAISIFLSCSVTVYAFPCRLKDGTWIDKPWSEAGEEIWLTIQYGLSQIGVFFANGADFKQWLQNTETYQDLWDENGRLAKHTSIDTKTGTVKYDKEIMSVLKSAADDYAKEHEPYHMAETYPLDAIPMSEFAGHKNVYDTLVNLLNESPSGVVMFGCNEGTMCFTDLGQWFTRVSPVLTDPYNASPDIERITFYQNENWNVLNFRVWYIYSSIEDAPIKTAKEFSDNADGYNQGNSYYSPVSNYHRVFKKPRTQSYGIYANGSSSNELYVISKDRRRIRVFNTYGDFQNFTLGKRSIYYTENYYNYVPEDLSVSIDDLQKTVDDLSKVIDELLKQIQDNTDESEIEELLRQILEALKNQQGGGGGTGGGDVNVDIDLSTTNGLLSKILAKVTQIFDKLSESVEGVSDSVHTKIQDTLDEMLVQIKKLKHWTMADTAVNAADAVADWLDFLKGIFDDMENGAGNAVAAISSGMDGATGLLKTKFPFCIPWDVAFLVTFLAHEPETPVFKLPIHLESIGIDEYIEVDMSDFSGISTISRTILMLIYCYGLLNLTMKIIPMAKEGS